MYNNEFYIKKRKNKSEYKKLSDDIQYYLLLI